MAGQSLKGLLGTSLPVDLDKVATLRIRSYVEDSTQRLKFRARQTLMRLDDGIFKVNSADPP